MATSEAPEETKTPAHMLKASENGTPPEVYAERVMKAQSPTSPRGLIEARIYDAMGKQGYHHKQISAAVRKVLK